MGPVAPIAARAGLKTWRMSHRRGYAGLARGIGMRVFFWSLVLSAGMLVGCFPRGDPAQPIPTLLINAPQTMQRLVVVLPGRADDLAGLRKSGIAQAVQSSWPEPAARDALIEIDNRRG